MSRATAVRTWPTARETRRRYIPALPTLWPGMLAPLAVSRPPAFPFGAKRMTRFYLARNAVYHGAKLIGLPGHEVLVPAYHHGVEVGALAAAGAIPRFVRVDARMRLDLEDLEAKIGPRTRALYVIHYAGFAQPMDDVMAVARRHGLPVVEDCALSLFAAEGRARSGRWCARDLLLLQDAPGAERRGARGERSRVPGDVRRRRRRRSYRRSPTRPARSSRTPRSGSATSARRSAALRGGRTPPCAAPPGSGPCPPAR
jgi:hypothetical protein